jgi:hypothetical protein
MPRVLNKKVDGVPVNAIYVGRPTKWGNPFSHFNGTLAMYRTNSLKESIDQYKIWIDNILEKDPSALQRLQKELKGKDLVCWCAPKACHADYLLYLANQ